jgi:hypothetical protein
MFTIYDLRFTIYNPLNYAQIGENNANNMAGKRRETFITPAAAPQRSSITADNRNGRWYLAAYH